MIKLFAMDLDGTSLDNNSILRKETIDALKKLDENGIKFVFTSGTEFPEDLSGFHLIIHCGGCMLNEREMKYRLRMAVDQNIPMTNYGVAIAYMTGILERSVRPFITLIS